MTTDQVLREPSWPQARAAAHAAGTPLPASEVPLAAAIGTTLAAPLVALHPIPPFDTSMMDGWAVSGDGPWQLVGEVLAGSVGARLTAGQAVVIATGAQVPAGAAAVIRREHGEVAEGRLQAPPPPAGADYRLAGEECSAGEELLPAGTKVTAPVAGLAASAGYDVVSVRQPPSADVFVLGDELLAQGLPRKGQIRDSLGVQVPAWASAAGCRKGQVVTVPDTLPATIAGLDASKADLLLTTGGTARGPVDHLHGAIADLGGELVVDEVAVRPGHPMLLARLPGDRYLVGLPGNPMAAAVAFCTLALPLLAGLAERRLPELDFGRLTAPIGAPATEHRLVPAIVRGGTVSPLPHQGSAMLRGLARATHFAISPPGGATEGSELSLLELPWH